MEILKDIGTFIWAVLNTWQAYMTGGIVIALLFVYERVSKKTVSLRTFLIVVAVFLFASFFLAWRVEYRRAEGLNSSTTRLNEQNKSLQQDKDTLIGKLVDKERPIVLQTVPDPQVEKLLRRQDEELAKMKSSLPSPKKRALQVSNDLLRFLAERERAQPAYPMPHGNTTKEEFTQQQDMFQRAYVQWMNETAAECQTRFAVPLAEVLQDMKTEKIDTAGADGVCSFFNGNTFAIQRCATNIGVLAQKLSH